MCIPWFAMYIAVIIYFILSALCSNYVMFIFLPNKINQSLVASLISVREKLTDFYVNFVTHLIVRLYRLTIFSDLNNA